MIFLGVLALFGILAWFYMRKNFIRPLILIRNNVTEFAENNAESTIRLNSIQTGDEIQELAISIHQMEKDIVSYIDNIQTITAEKERIGAELNVATQIQADMLPRIFPAFPERHEFDIYATMDPAKEVGGDFYDFFLVDDDHLCLVMADVSGKGVPAALFMVIAKTLIKNRAQMGDSPAEILYNVNNQLCEGNEAEMFVTVWLAIIELSTGKGVAANAGHEHPAICRKDGKYELVVYRHSPAVAAMEGIPFREHSFELHPGDRLFVYTDGVPEATNADNELFGTDRMLEALNRIPWRSPERCWRTSGRRSTPLWATRRSLTTSPCWAGGAALAGDGGGGRGGAGYRHAGDERAPDGGDHPGTLAGHGRDLPDRIRPVRGGRLCPARVGIPAQAGGPGEAGAGDRLGGGDREAEEEDPGDGPDLREL